MTADRGSDAGWKGGKQLGVALSLTSLRKTWEDTPENRAQTLELWTRSATVPPRKEIPLDLKRWNTTQQHLAVQAIALGKVDPSDEQWMSTSQEAAAVWAQLALQSQGPEAAAYSAVAREMARASQDRRYRARAATSGMRDAARHFSLIAMAGSPSSARGTLAVVEQMMRITEAVRAARRHGGNGSARSAWPPCRASSWPRCRASCDAKQRLWVSLAAHPVRRWAGRANETGIAMSGDDDG